MSSQPMTLLKLKNRLVHLAIVFGSASVIGVANEALVRLSLRFFNVGHIAPDAVGLIAAITAMLVILGIALMAALD